MDGKWCDADGYFYNLTSAEQYCSHDVRCKGIYDNDCSGDYFYICEIGLDYEDSSKGDCVYDKRGIQKYLIT